MDAVTKLEQTAPRAKRRKRTIEGMLTDPTVPMKMRLRMLREVASGEDEAAEQVLSDVIESAVAGSAGSQFVAKTKALGEKLAELPISVQSFELVAEI